MFAASISLTSSPRAFRTLDSLDPFSLLLIQLLFLGFFLPAVDFLPLASCFLLSAFDSALPFLSSFSFLSLPVLILRLQVLVVLFTVVFLLLA